MSYANAMLQKDDEDDEDEDTSSAASSSDSRDTGVFNSSGELLAEDADCSAISNFFGYWKNLINQEAKFQGQLNDLTKQLSQRDAEANKLRFQMEELQRDVFAKSAGMDRLQQELQAAHKESEFVKQKLHNLETELLEAKHKNSGLGDEIYAKTDELCKCEAEATEKIARLEATVEELRRKVSQLEKLIEELNSEKETLQHRHDAVLEAKAREKRLVEEALQEALRQKDTLGKKWEEEFEKLRTVGILKEQTLLDDFEWKLREVEKSSKAKLINKDRVMEERLVEARKEAEEKMRQAEAMLVEVERLRTRSTECEELKDRAKLQDKNMEVLRDQRDELRAAETTLKEETRRLRSLVELEKENLQHMQRMHHQEIADKERWLHQTLEEKKTEIAVYWEDKLLSEIGRLKYELEQLYYEEKHAAVEALVRNKEDEFLDAKSTWERKIEDCMKEIAHLKKTLADREQYYHKAMEAQQTITDRDIMELRRIMDKIDNAHHERFEKLVNEHERELDKLSKEHEHKLKDIESHWHTQITSINTKLESTREQMEKESQHKIQDLIEEHRSELDEQWANLVHQKSEAIKLVENEYVSKYKTLEEQFQIQQKSHEAREVELLKAIDSLKNDLLGKNATVEDLQGNVDTLESGIEVLRSEVAHQGEQLMKNRRDADQKIRGLQDVLMKLQALQEREHEQFQARLAQQQKQAQTTIEHLQKKCSTMSKLFEEVRSRYERRESRSEDLTIISDLRQVIAEQEKDLACMNEEKRFYQMQLIRLQRSLDGPEITEIEDDGDGDADEEVEEVFADAEGSMLHHPPPLRMHHPPPVSANVSIPPTIIECDDDEIEDDKSV